MNAISSKKLEEILLTVSRPARYLGNEWNIVRKDLGRVDVKVALLLNVGMRRTRF